MAKAPTPAAVANVAPVTEVATNVEVAETVVIDNTDAPSDHAKEAEVDSTVELGDGTVQVNYV